MDFISAFIEGASEIVTSFGSLLGSAASAVTSIFWVAETGLTVVGAALAFGLVTGLVYLFIRMVRGLIKANFRG